jgi:hypothetical protein
VQLACHASSYDIGAVAPQLELVAQRSIQINSGKVNRLRLLIALDSHYDKPYAIAVQFLRVAQERIIAR